MKKIETFLVPELSLIYDTSVSRELFRKCLSSTTTKPHRSLAYITDIFLRRVKADLGGTWPRVKEIDL